MSGVLYPLIAEGAHDSSGTTLIGIAADGSGNTTGEFENALPPCGTRWDRMFSKVVYTISVLGTSGTTPTSWSLGARFEQHLAHTQGYQFQFGTWAPLQDEQLAACVQEGVGFYCPTSTVNYAGQPTRSAATYGIIADSTAQADDGSGVLASALTVPAGGQTSGVLITKRITASRTVINQLGGMRVRLKPTITGGDTTTRIILSAQALGVR